MIISAPGKNDDLTIVMGVNESLYSPDKHYVISNGSCTTNGLAPAAQVLHQHFGIKHGLMNTTHAYTNSQALHDQPEKDLRGARAAALSIVPYSSGAAKALGNIRYKGKGSCDRTCQHGSRLRWAKVLFIFSTPFNFSWRFCLWTRLELAIRVRKRCWRLFENHVCG